MAKVIGICLSNGLGSPSSLQQLFDAHLVKDGMMECFKINFCILSDTLLFLGLSLDFAQVLFKSWLQEKDIQGLATALKKCGLESRLLVG